MDLRAVTNMLLRAPDVARQLKLADSYIQAFNRVPDQFVLPAKHAHLKAVIEAFASDTKAFGHYIRALRDSAEGGAYDELHELYRVVSLRAVQVERRNRIRRAVVLLLPRLQADLHQDVSYDDQTRAARFVEKRWGAMRLAAMAAERKLRRVERLSAEERAIVLDNFWRDIDNKLASGKVDLGDDAAYQELCELLTPR